MKNERLLLLLLLFVCVILFFSRLADIPLYNNDEGIHAVTSKEMVLSGDWVTTTFNGEPFYDKPVLYNWLAALCFLVFGFTEFAARLPAALLGVGSVMVTYALGRCMSGPLLGFLGGMILATSPEFITLSRAVVHDISLVFFISLTLCLFFRGYAASNNRKFFFLACYAAAGFAVLAKGPVGVVLPGVIIGLFLIMKGRLTFIKEMSLGWGVLIFLLVVAPWYVLISLENREYAGYFFITQNLMNFVSSKLARHPEPFYYYVPVLMGGLTPWSVFLPLALWRPFRNGLRQMDDASLFLLLWFGVVFFFFSSAASKLGTYILPLFPAVALLVGHVFHEVMTVPTTALRRYFVYSYAPLAAMFVLAFVYGWVWPPYVVRDRYGIDLQAGQVFLFVLAVISVGAFVSLLRDRYRTFFAGNVALVVVGILTFLFVFVPSMNPYRTTKQISRKWDAALAPGEPLVFFKEIRDTALFYTNRRARQIARMDELVDHLVSEGNPYVVVARKYYDRVELLSRISDVVHREGHDLLLAGKIPAQDGSEGSGLKVKPDADG